MSRAFSMRAIISGSLLGWCLAANGAIAGGIPTDMAISNQSGPALAALEDGILVEPFALLEHVLYSSAGSSLRAPFWGGISLSGNGTLPSPASPRNSDRRFLAHHEDSTVVAFRCRPEMAKELWKLPETNERSS